MNFSAICCSPTRRRWSRPRRRCRGRDREMPVPERHFVLGTPLRAAVPRRDGVGGLRDGLLLGRRARVLAGPRHLHDRGRLRRRVHAEPDLRGGLLGLDRPRRGRARRVRPGGDLLRGDAAPVLGEPRPDPGHAPGQRRRHPVPLGDLHRRDRPSRRPPSARRDAYARAAGRARPRRDHDRDRARRARSTTPRTTTSSTSRRTPAATAGSAAPA